MVWAFGKNSHPIGVDITEDSLRLVQLRDNGKRTSLIAGGSELCPDDIRPETTQWHDWAAKTLRRIVSKGSFSGSEIITALPATETFIDHIKKPNAGKGKMEEAIIASLKSKLPFDPQDAIIRHFTTIDNNLIVLAIKRSKVDGLLSIYEKADLIIKSISLWPLALANTYAKLFCRRNSDRDAIVMLLDIQTDFTNVTICQSNIPLFARSIKIGLRQMQNDDAVSRLLLELTSSIHKFGLIHKNLDIERLIFLSGSYMADEGRNICMKIAEQLEMPTQIADCLAAIDTANLHGHGIDSKRADFSWATAFGLSLS
jgi:Tfp pilus assembly PilM family ATPase